MRLILEIWRDVCGTRDPALVDMWETSYQNMKYQSSLRRDARSLAEVKEPRECPEEWIAELVWLNFISVPIIKIVTSNINRVSRMWIYMLFVCGIGIDD